MWVIKTHGETYYVNHVDCNVPWSTKETPENYHTKGSLKVKDCLLNIDGDNNATIDKLSIFDKIRIRNEKQGITRIACGWHSKKEVEQAIKQSKIKHGPFKRVGGSCGSQYFITDIYEKSELSFLMLSVGEKFRVLMPNEAIYRAYDDAKHDPDWYDKDMELEDED